MVHEIKPKRSIIQGQRQLVMDLPRDMDADKVVQAIREAIEGHWCELQNEDQQKYRNTCAASLRVATVVVTDPTFTLITLPPPRSEEATELVDAMAGAIFSTHPASKAMSWQQARLDIRMRGAMGLMATTVLNALSAWSEGVRPTGLSEGG